MYKSLLLSLFTVIALSSTISAQGPVLVKTEKVVEKTFHDQIKLVGRTQGIIESKIVAEIAGQVSGQGSGEGVFVNTGDVLLQIDAKTLKLDLDAKEAEVQQTELEAKLAAEQKERAVKLSKDNMISTSGLDSAVTWDAILNARHKKLSAELGKLRIDYENSAIKAPFSGFTGRKLVDVGEWVTPGMPVFELVDISKIKIIVQLPERYFGHLENGSKVRITSSQNDYINFEGTVVGISATASEETHTYPVIIEVKNKDNILASGMLVQVTLSLKEQFNSLAIPKDAVVRQGNNHMVYTIVEGKASPIPVTILSTYKDMLAVEAPGLTANSMVITRGNERIYPGSDVTTGDAQPEQQEEKAVETTAENN